MSVYLRKIRIGGLSYGMNMKESVMEVIDVFKSGGRYMRAAALFYMHSGHYDRAGHVLSPGRKNLGIFVDNLPDMLLNKSWNDAYVNVAQEDNAAAFMAQEGIRARWKERICGWHWIRRTVRPPPNFEPI